jgi:hypothetical protein
MVDFLRWFLVGVACGFTAVVSVAHAQDNPYGASYLGFCHRLWPCERSLRVFDGVPVKRLGFLAPPTFGKDCPCYKRFQKLPGPKYVRVTLANGTCFRERGRTCGAGELFEGESLASADRKLRRRDGRLLKRYRTNVGRVKALLAGSSDTIERLALCLECPVSGPAREALLSVARKVFPDGVFVDSVLTQPCLPGLICEKHGAAPKLSAPCIADTDGVSHTAIDVDEYRAATAACEASFLWAPRFNLIDTSRPGFVPPADRTTRPTGDDFTAVWYWLND